MADDTDAKFERLMALVERLCSAMSTPHAPPVVNVNIDLGSLARALERRKPTAPTATQIVVDHRGPTPVPG